MLEFSKKEGEELLHLASKNGQVYLIKNLLRAKVDINALNAEGLSSLHWAVINGNIEVTKLLIEKGANIEIKDSGCGSSPLLFACQNGRTKIVKFLIEKGADINTKNSKGSNAIHFAAQSGKTEIVDFLLQNGLEINMKDNNGENPLFYAMYYRHFPIMREAIHAYEMVKFLIENGVNVDEATVSNQTPLTFAIMKNLLAVVNLLVSFGADVNHAKDSNGTLLQIATTWYCDTEIMKVLIANGADVNAPHEINKTTSLHVATGLFCSTEICEIIRILFESGANPELRQADGFTPFEIALRCRNYKFVKMNIGIQSQFC